MITAKKTIKRLAKSVVSTACGWRAVSRSMVRASQFLCSVRMECEIEQSVAAYPELAKAMARKQVLAGPFQGMLYGDAEAFCSALPPKLLGSYERELACEITRAIDSGFDLIVDVGAADGYYAVGFALKMPGAEIIAYEQEARARKELAKLANANGVRDRITIRDRCESSDLFMLPVSGGLLIVDCEGFEEELLSQDVIEHLRNWEFIIETHDGYSNEITKRLASRFEATHKVVTIEVIHDLDKADHFDSDILSNLPRNVKDKLLTENRQHACLRWIVCHPKT